MNKTLLSSIVLSGLLSYGAQGSPLLYTDYVVALDAPISKLVQKYVSDGSDPERIMNILLRQSQRVTPQNMDIFLDNIRFVKAQADYAVYRSTLEQLSIQTLMLNGDMEKGIETIVLLPASERSKYTLLSVNALLQLGRVSEAVDIFNAMPSDFYEQNEELALNTAQSIVVDNGVPSETLRLPDNGNALLALRLASFYERYGLYAKSLSAHQRYLSFISSLSKQQTYRQSLVEFAKEHDLVEDERMLMEDYLMAASADQNELVGDVELINEYSQQLVRYYFDPRNEKLQSQWLDQWLEAQRRAGENDTKTYQQYLANRLYRYDASRPASFYTDAVELAKLMQQRLLISDVYSPSLPEDVQQALFAGYFSIPAEVDDNTLVMTESYAQFIEQCDESIPIDVRALKAHQLVEANQYEAARQCFASVIWESSSLPTEMQYGLQQEQAQVDYLAMKQEGNEPAMVAIALDGDENIRLDAALSLVDSTPFTRERLAFIEGVNVVLGLSSEQQKQVDEQVNARLFQEEQMALLIPRLAQSPDKYALELAYWYMSQDQQPEAMTHLLLRLTQPSPLAEDDDVKVVRYLDSVFNTLPEETQQQIRQLPQQSVQTMLRLRDYETSIEDAFNIDPTDTMSAVKEALGQYNQMKAELGSVSFANVSAQLWVLGNVEWQLSALMNRLAVNAPVALKPVLEQQAEQRKTLASRYAQKILEQKIEGVTDARVLNAMLFIGEQ